jgi:hypothetical protein
MSQVGFVAAALIIGLCGCTEAGEERSITGLRIFERHADKDVSGTFVDGDASLDFSFSVDGRTRIAIIRSADGRPLIESRLVDGIETTTYLGRVTLHGVPTGGVPGITGDPTNLDELANLPEAQLVEPLREALEQRGVENTLYKLEKRSSCSSWSWWAHCDASRLVSRL